MVRATWLWAGVCVLLGLGAAHAAEPVPGIPIDHQLTINKCGGCHQRDANGMMRRLSYIRTSPEVWEQAIKRMVRLNGVVLTADDAREIAKYLSSNNGLAPEEAKPVFWEAEHRLFRDQSDKIPSEALQHTCNYCHTVGRVLTQRRTRDDYEKLINMHVGFFPGSENVFRPRQVAIRDADVPVALSAPTGGNPSVIRPATSDASKDGKTPVDLAVDYLATAQPLMTPEWSAWKAAMRTPKLDGRWLLTGYQQGKGRLFGIVTIIPGAAPDEFTTKVEVEYAATAETLSKTGKGIVYTGYSWRGRATAPGGVTPPARDPSGNPREWREALFASRDGNTLDGRWFWGGYDEFGIDVHLTRITGAQTLVAGTSAFSLQSPSETDLRIYGANFPQDLKPADFDFGAGVTVTRIVRRTPIAVTVAVQLAAGLPTAIRDVSVNHATAERAVAVYDKIAYIKTIPDASMARLGGIVAPKQYAQFEAIAYAAGPDGTPQTADDIPLGPVPARWSMSEFVSTPGDDDVKFTGALSETGLFTPNVEGPNPERKKQANNYPTENWGDVWVEATYDAPGGTTVMARSYLVVTIPVYVRYDQPEVAR